MRSANGKSRGARRRPPPCPVCSATDTQIRRAVEQCIDFREGPDTPSPAKVIYGHIIVFKRIRNHLLRKKGT